MRRRGESLTVSGCSTEKNNNHIDPHFNTKNRKNRKVKLVNLSLFNCIYIKVLKYGYSLAQLLRFERENSV